MDKDTKLILIMLAVIVVLAGAFIWKVAMPKEEKKISYEKETNTVLKSEEEISSNNQQNIKENEKYDIEDLRNNIEDSRTILFLENTKEDNEMVLKVVKPIFLIALTSTIIAVVIKFKDMAFSNKISKRMLIGLIIFATVSGINTIRYVNINKAIEYAIENESWYHEIDTIKRVRQDDGKTIIYLKKHGKQQVMSFLTDYREGQEVEILIVKGRFGGEYEIGIK